MVQHRHRDRAASLSPAAVFAPGPSGDAYELLPNFPDHLPHHRPAATPVIDRLAFTNALPNAGKTRLGQAYARPMINVLSNVTPTAYVPRRCCKFTSPQAGPEYDDDDDPDCLDRPLLRRRSSWSPVWASELPESIKKTLLPEFCEHGRRVSRWTLRYDLPRLPGFPEYVTPSVKVVVCKYPSGLGIVNHFHEVVINLTRLKQAHLPIRYPNAGTWYPKRMHDNDRMTNLVLFSPMYATNGRFLAGLEQLEAHLLAQIVNEATVQCRRLLDQARAHASGLPRGIPVARLKYAEVNQDVFSDSPSDDIQARLDAARHMLASITNYTDYDGGYGPHRNQCWIKIYGKTTKTYRPELFLGSKALKSLFKVVPVLWPATTSRMREILDTLAWKYLELADEIESTCRLGQYDPATLNWTPLFEHAGINPDDHQIARQLIVDHHNTPVPRTRYNKAQKKILTKLQSVGVYDFNCKGPKGVGRIIPGAAMAALKAAIKAKRAAMRERRAAVATR